MKTKSLYYRPDIDGLRGIAILAVLVYHVWPLLLPNGYLGVDIFFVISGYLITSILVREHSRNSFTFGSFYQRRILRLLPALCLVLVAVSISGYLWLLPDEYLSLGEHLSGAAIFSSNFSLLREVGYFDVSSTRKVLLHLWSLAIEEQFYLIWPVIIFIAYKMKRNIRSIQILCAFLLVVSLMLYIGYSANEPDKAFYLPQARFWEIALGALVSLFKLETLSNPLEKIRMLQPAPCLSLLVIFCLFKWDWSHTYAPIIVCLATILIMICPESLINKNVLSLRTLVYIGLISYPLYLWHWPLLVFNRLGLTDFRPLRHSDYLFEVGLSFALAILTYHLIESPLNLLGSKSKRRLSSGLFTILVAVGVSGVLIEYSFIQPISNGEFFQELSRAKSDWEYYEGTVTQIEIGQNKNETLFIGDSNVEQYYPRIKELIEADPQLNKAMFITGTGCIPVPRIKNLKQPYCADFLKNAMDYARNKNITSVVIAAHWYSYFYSHKGVYVLNDTGEALTPDGNVLVTTFDYFQKFVQQISQNRKVYIVLNIPVDYSDYLFDPAYMVRRNFPFGARSIMQDDFKRANFDAEMRPINEQLRKVAKNVGAEIIDPMEYLCDEKVCKTLNDSKPIYKDYAHLRASYVKSHIRFLDHVLKP